MDRQNANLTQEIIEQVLITFSQSCNEKRFLDIALTIINYAFFADDLIPERIQHHIRRRYRDIGHQVLLSFIT